MTETFTKTVKLRLREPTKRKEKKIQEAMDQSLKCANKATERLPSLPNDAIKNRSGTVYNIVKDLRNNGISLNAQCAYQAVEKARSSYLSKIMNGNYKTLPKFKNKFLRLHNSENIDRFFEKNGTKYVTLKLFPYEKIHLPFSSGDYQDCFLRKILGGYIDYGGGEIKKYDYGYSLNLTIKKEVDIDYEPETFIGVDLGLNVLAWAVALDSEGKFLDETHFDGGEAGFVRDRCYKQRKELQEKGNLKKEKEIGDYEHRWMENKNHNISRRVIEFAKEFDNPLIILEDIDTNELRDRVDNPKVHKWTVGDLRNFIEYKAIEEGIKTKEVDPKYTSQRCSNCGHISENNREGIDFKCEECGYENHADFNAGKNIALKDSDVRQNTNQQD